MLNKAYLPLWWNWQTRRTQNTMVAIPCRFDSDQRHQTRIKRTLMESQSSFYFLQEIIRFNRKGKTIKNLMIKGESFLPFIFLIVEYVFLK